MKTGRFEFPDTTGCSRAPRSGRAVGARLGIDHERLTLRYQGLDQRLTGIDPTQVIKKILA